MGEFQSVHQGTGEPTVPAACSACSGLAAAWHLRSGLMENASQVISRCKPGEGAVSAPLGRDGRSATMGYRGEFRIAGDCE